MASVGKTRVRGITIKLDADTTNIAKQLGSLNTQLNNTQRDLKDVQSLLKLDPKNAELLRQKQELLNQEIQKTKERLEVAKKALEELEKADKSPEVTRQMDALKRQIIDDTNTLESLEKEFEEFGDIAKQQALAAAEEWKQLGEKISGIGESMSNVGTTLTRKVSVPIVKAGKSMVESASDFESAMDKVNSVTVDATAEDMEALSSLAMDLSKTSKYSATEIGDAMYYMGLAGWDVKEIYAGLPAVLDLAAAGDVDLARASDIVTDYVTAFGYSAEESTRLVDVMARTMTNSNTDVDLLGESFKYAAAIAGGFGYDVEDVALALGLMANNGVKGSQAGTTLRNIMSRMAKPTKEVSDAMEALNIHLEDGNGNILPFRDVMDQLRESMGKSAIPTDEMARKIEELESALDAGTISEEEYEQATLDLAAAAYGMTGVERVKNAAILGGLRGMTGLLAIVNADADAYNDLADAIDNSGGAASEVAEIMLDNFSGQMTLLRHNIQNLGIELGNILLPVISKAVEWIGKVVDKLRALSPETKETILKIAGIVAAIGPLLVIGGKLTVGIGNLIKAAGTIKAAFAGVSAAASGVGIAIGAVVAVIAAAVIAYNAINNSIKEHAQRLYGLNEDEKTLISTIQAESEEYLNLEDSRMRASQAALNETSEIEALWKELDNYTDAQGNVHKQDEERAQFIVDTLNVALGLEIEMVDGQIQKYGDLKKSVEEVILEKKKEALLAANQEAYGKATEKVVDAYGDYQDALKAHNKAVERTKKAEQALEDFRNSSQYQALSQMPGQYLALNMLVEQYEEDIRVAKESEQSLNATLQTSRETYLGYERTIKNYEAVLNGNTESTEEFRDVLNNLAYNFKEYGTSTEKELQAQYQYFTQHYDRLKKAAEDGVGNISQSELDGIAEMIRKSAGELEKGRYQYQQHGVLAGQSYVIGTEKGIEGGADGINQSAKSVTPKVSDYGEGYTRGEGYTSGTADGITGSKHRIVTAAGKIKESLPSLYNSGYNTGANYGDGLAAGISAKADKVARATANLATNSIQKKANYILDIRSPSRKAMETGEYWDLGLIKGLESLAGKVGQASESVSERIMGASVDPFTNFTSPDASAFQRATQTNSTTNVGGINFTINAAPGQSEEEIADMVSERIDRQMRQLKAAYS